MLYSVIERTIVVGIDGSTPSLRAAAYAVGLARREQCRLIAVYVRTLPASALALVDSGGHAAAATVDAHDAVERQLRAALGGHASLVVRTGEPFTELLEAAEELHADAVIVGRSANALHRIAGSVAVRLVRSARWPVTVVP
jgi:nucleotide-binding universal stress UspA family protein